ncbi:hypothetical protein OF83DRAFT_26314 [Amylostereum chailletii]|nr:hypothetical protein OF83DRAFT_26314 [Amylostereum chailletii]
MTTTTPSSNTMFLQPLTAVQNILRQVFQSPTQIQDVLCCRLQEHFLRTSIVSRRTVWPLYSPYTRSHTCSSLARSTSTIHAFSSCGLMSSSLNRTKLIRFRCSHLAYQLTGAVVDFLELAEHTALLVTRKFNPTSLLCPVPPLLLPCLTAFGTTPRAHPLYSPFTPRQVLDRPRSRLSMKSTLLPARFQNTSPYPPASRRWHPTSLFPRLVSSVFTVYPKSFLSDYTAQTVVYDPRKVDGSCTREADFKVFKRLNSGSFGKMFLARDPHGRVRGDKGDEEVPTPRGRGDAQRCARSRRSRWVFEDREASFSWHGKAYLDIVMEVCVGAHRFRHEIGRCLRR